MKKIILPVVLVISSFAFLASCSHTSTPTKKAEKDTTKKAVAKVNEDTIATPVTYPPLNKHLYDSLMKKLANGDTTGKWPVKNAPYPLPGAILPFKRVVAFYGNLSAKKMGILGELPPKEMLAKLGQYPLSAAVPRERLRSAHCPVRARLSGAATTGG